MKHKTPEAILDMPRDEAASALSLDAWRLEYSMTPEAAAKLVHAYAERHGYPFDLLTAFGDMAETIRKLSEKYYVRTNPYLVLSEAQKQYADDPESLALVYEDVVNLMEAVDPTIGQVIGSRQTTAGWTASTWAVFVAYFVLAVESPDSLKEIHAAVPLSRVPHPNKPKPASFTYATASEPTLIYAEYLLEGGNRYVPFEEKSPHANVPQLVYNLIRSAYLKRPLKRPQVVKVLRQMRNHLHTQKKAGGLFHIYLADWNKGDMSRILNHIPKGSDLFPPFQQFAEANAKAAGTGTPDTTVATEPPAPTTPLYSPEPPKAEPVKKPVTFYNKGIIPDAALTGLVSVLAGLSKTAPSKYAVAPSTELLAPSTILLGLSAFAYSQPSQSWDGFKPASTIQYRMLSQSLAIVLGSVGGYDVLYCPGITWNGTRYSRHANLPVVNATDSDTHKGALDKLAAGLLGADLVQALLKSNNNNASGSTVTDWLHYGMVNQWDSALLLQDTPYVSKVPDEDALPVEMPYKRKNSLVSFLHKAEYKTTEADSPVRYAFNFFVMQGPGSVRVMVPAYVLKDLEYVTEAPTNKEAPPPAPGATTYEAGKWYQIAGVYGVGSPNGVAYASVTKEAHFAALVDCKYLPTSGGGKTKAEAALTFDDTEWHIIKSTVGQIGGKVKVGAVKVVLRPIKQDTIIGEFEYPVAVDGLPKVALFATGVYTPFGKILLDLLKAKKVKAPAPYHGWPGEEKAYLTGAANKEGKSLVYNADWPFPGTDVRLGEAEKPYKLMGYLQDKDGVVEAVLKHQTEGYWRETLPQGGVWTFSVAPTYNEATHPDAIHATLYAGTIPLSGLVGLGPPEGALAGAEAVPDFDLPLASAGCVVLVSKADALPYVVIRQSTKTWSHPDGNWSLPKGQIEGGQSPAYTAWKETLEETGIDVKPSLLISTHKHGTAYFLADETDKTYLPVFLPPGPETSNVAFLATAVNSAGALVLKDKKGVQGTYKGIPHEQYKAIETGLSLWYNLHQPAKQLDTVSSPSRGVPTTYGGVLKLFLDSATIAELESKSPDVMNLKFASKAHEKKVYPNAPFPGVFLGDVFGADGVVYPLRCTYLGTIMGETAFSAGTDFEKLKTMPPYLWYALKKVDPSIVFEGPPTTVPIHTGTLKHHDYVHAVTHNIPWKPVSSAEMLAFIGGKDVATPPATLTVAGALSLLGVKNPGDLITVKEYGDAALTVPDAPLPDGVHWVVAYADVQTKDGYIGHIKFLVSTTYVATLTVTVHPHGVKKTTTNAETKLPLYAAYFWQLLKGPGGKLDQSTEVTVVHTADVKGLVQLVNYKPFFVKLPGEKAMLAALQHPNKVVQPQVAPQVKSALESAPPLMQTPAQTTSTTYKYDNNTAEYLGPSPGNIPVRDADEDAITYKYPKGDLVADQCVLAGNLEESELSIVGNTPSGSNPSRFFKDQKTGLVVMVKGSKDKYAALRAQGEAAAYNVMGILTNSVVPVYAYDADELDATGGKSVKDVMGLAHAEVTAQPALPEGSTMLDPDINKLSAEDIKVILAQHVLDMFLGDFDAGYKNWMRTTNGRLVAIDKGQSFKLLAQGHTWPLDPFQPNKAGAIGKAVAIQILQRWVNEPNYEIPEAAFVAMRQAAVDIGVKINESRLADATESYLDAVSSTLGISVEQAYERVVTTLAKTAVVYYDRWRDTMLSLAGKAGKAVYWPPRGEKTLAVPASPIVSIEGFQWTEDSVQAIPQAKQRGWAGVAVRADAAFIRNQNVVVKAVRNSKADAGKMEYWTLLHFRFTPWASDKLEAMQNGAEFVSNIVSTTTKNIKETSAEAFAESGGVFPFDTAWQPINTAIRHINHHALNDPKNYKGEGAFKFAWKPNKTSQIAAARAIVEHWKKLVEAESGDYIVMAASNGSLPVRKEHLNDMVSLYTYYINTCQTAFDDLNANGLTSKYAYPQMQEPIAATFADGSTGPFKQYVAPSYDLPKAKEASAVPKKAPSYAVHIIDGTYYVPVLATPLRNPGDPNETQLTTYKTPSTHSRIAITPEVSMDGVKQYSIIHPSGVEFHYSGYGNSNPGFNGRAWAFIDEEPTPAAVAKVLKVIGNIVGIKTDAPTPEEQDALYWINQARNLQTGGSTIGAPTSSAAYPGAPNWKKVGVASPAMEAVIDAYAKDNNPQKAISLAKNLVAEKMKVSVKTLENQAAGAQKFIDEPVVGKVPTRIGWTAEKIYAAAAKIGDIGLAHTITQITSSEELKEHTGGMSNTAVLMYNVLARNGGLIAHSYRRFSSLAPGGEAYGDYKGGGDPYLYGCLMYASGLTNDHSLFFDLSLLLRSDVGIVKPTGDGFGHVLNHDIVFSIEGLLKKSYVKTSMPSKGSTAQVCVEGCLDFRRYLIRAPLSNPAERAKVTERVRQVWGDNFLFAGKYTPEQVFAPA